MYRFASSAFVLLFLCACAGRAPQPVAVVQPQDQFMDCAAIFAEVQANNRRVQELADEQGWKVAQNVAAGVAGFVVPVLWFGMDWQGTASKEASALQARQQYLATLAQQRNCGAQRTTNRELCRTVVLANYTEGVISLSLLSVSRLDSIVASVL